MTYVGVDIAKASFEASELLKGRYRHQSFANNAEGFEKFSRWLKGTACHVCMEATNSYGVALAKYLSAQGIKLSVVNPARIKHFAKSELSRNKTDKLDAALIARFCQEKAPRLWQPPSEEQASFQALYRRWETIKAIKSQEQTRLGSERCEQVRSSIEAHLSYLDEQLGAVEAALDSMVQKHPPFKHRVELLLSIPGIGKITAYFLLAELPFERFERANQVVAFAGLNPKKNDSGNFKGRRSISKTGSGRIRKALYFPAISAITFNPLITPLALRLELKGHVRLSIICAAMRKLLHLAFGVVKSDAPFDPHFLQKA